MSLLSLFGTLLLIFIIVGVALWAINYLFGSYIQADVLNLMNKAVVVLLVIVLVVFVLQVIGLIGPLSSLRIGR